eukprot:5916885-Alexandrium_andersonii.AAC.1
MPGLQGHMAGPLSSLTRARPFSACRITGSARSRAAAAFPLPGSRSSWPLLNTGWRSTTALTAPLSPGLCTPAS